MPAVRPQVLLRLGSHAEKDYFLKTLHLWNGLIVGANLLESAPGATSSLVVRFAGEKNQVPYFVDPMTYAFGTYIERGSSVPRNDLDWIKSDQKVKNTPRTERRYKRSYLALAKALGGPILAAVERDRGIGPLELAAAAIRALCEATLRYQVTRVRDEFEADPEFRDVAADIPSPGALFAPYFYIAPDDLEGGLRFFSACAETAVSLKPSGPVHAVLCTDVSSLDSQEFLGNAVARIKDSGVSGVWLWFSRFYEEAASTPMLQEFRRFVEELSQHVSVFNMHGSYLSLALSRFGMSGISHGVGYGEQKDVIPVIGQSTPTVRYYLPDLKRRLGVPQIERALSNVGVKSTDDFVDKICGCVICRGVLGDSLGGFSSFGDLHYSTAESRRMAQTPAAAKQCRFHFLLNRARERDELTDLAPTVISRGFQKAYEKWKDQPTISGDVAHLLRWKRVFED